MTAEQERMLNENTRMTSELHAMLTKDGLLKTVQMIQENMVTQASCEAARKSCAAVEEATKNAHGKWWKSIDRVIVIILMIFTLLIGSGVLFRSSANAKQNKTAIEQNQEILDELKHLNQE